MTRSNTRNKQPTARKGVVVEQMTELGKQQTEHLDLAEYYRFLIDSLPIGIYVAQDGKLKVVNYSFCKLFGYAAEELLGIDSLSLVHPDDRHTVRENAVKMLKGKRSSQYEYRIVRKDGKIRWVQEAVLSFQHEGQRAMWGHLTEITEQKQLVQELRQSEERLHTLFETIRDGIIVVDLKGRIADVNEATLRMTGYGKEDLIGRSALDLVSRDDRAAAAERMIQTLEKGLTREMYTYRVLAADGREFDAEFSGAVMRDSSRNPAALVAVMRDVSDRKRAEEELTRLSNAVKMSSDSIVIGDLNANIVDVNEATLRMYGTDDKEELIGKNALHLIAPEEREKALISLKEVQEMGFCETREYNIATKSGGRLIVEMSTAMLKNADGKPMGLVAVSRDITERKRAQEDKELISAQLLQAQKMEAIGTLAGGIAHDFNNLIQAILGYASLAMTAVDEADPLYDYLKGIDSACSSAAGLTRQLLLFGRKDPTELDSVDINKIVQDVQLMLQRLIREDITVDTHLDPDVAPIEADPGNIEQVIMNLAINARDAMPEGGRLTFTTENVVLSEEECRTNPEARPGEYVCLSVVDTGTGINEEIIPRLFEPFFSTKDPSEGSGLGLSVVYGIVKQHGGWIHVQSSLGRGSTFRLYLPAVAQEPEAKIGETIPLEETKGNGNRIVLVEDDAGVREFLADAFSENGYAVFEAASAREALDMFDSREGAFDLVFTDIVLPDMTGFDLVKQIRGRQPEVPVLMGSGYMDNRLQELVMGERRFQIMQKPYIMAELLLAVRAAMGTDQA